MAIHPRISKALMLLDRGKVPEAEEALREALRESEREVDEANVVRASSILGELLYREGRDDEALPFLKRAASTVRDDDVLDYEINRAAEILNEIEQ